MSAQIFYNGDEQFYCKADTCKQSVDSISLDYLYSCTNIECQCITGLHSVIQGSTFCGGPGCLFDLTNILGTVEGGVSAIFKDSNVTTGYLYIDAIKTIFQKGISISCISGECVDSRISALSILIVAATWSTSQIIGTLLGGLLLAVCIFGLSLSYITQRKLKKLPLLPPRPGVKLTFKNIKYVVRGRQVLSDITGFAEPGRILAILGPSGTRRLIVKVPEKVHFSTLSLGR